MAYTDVLAASLQSLKAASADELRAKARTALHDAFRAACPQHRSQSPEELLMQARICPCLPRAT